MCLLEARGLAKQFKKRQVVNGVSISVSPGEIVGLLGPNGAGKTTTFNMIVGLVKPDDGEVVFEGNTIVSKPMHARARLGIGYLCLLYTSPSPRDATLSRMPSSA